jgi:hypothetical protein
MSICRKATFAVLFAAAVSAACLALTTNAAAGQDEAGSLIVGTWRGNSVCLVKGSACRDEANIYRFSKLAGKSGAFSGTGSKVVEGREILMGSSEWTYDATKHLLESKEPAIQMVVDRNRMNGELKLADRTAYRRISLKKDD